MTHQERDRLGLSLVLAVTIHTVIVVGLGLADWGIRDYPENNPVFVELLEYTTVPPVVEEEPEPVEPEETPPEEPAPEEPPLIDESPPPEEQLIQPEDPRPVDVDPEPTVPEQEVAPPAVPEVAATPAESAPAPEPRDAPPGSFDQSDLGWLESPSTDRLNQRTSDAELFTDPETAETGELPAWIAEGAIQPLSTLAPAERAALEQRVDAVPGLEARLDNILAGLDAARDRGTPSATTSDGTDRPSGIDLPGDSRLEFLGEGGRRPVGALTLPIFSSDDFGTLVPARIQYVIVFDVNADGLVVPGSLILRQGSGYTLADQKVRRAIATWRFEPAPGAGDVTAICTLIIERDDIR